MATDEDTDMDESTVFDDEDFRTKREDNVCFIPSSYSTSTNSKNTSKTRLDK